MGSKIKDWFTEHWQLGLYWCKICCAELRTPASHCSRSVGWLRNICSACVYLVPMLQGNSCTGRELLRTMTKSQEGSRTHLRSLPALSLFWPIPLAKTSFRSEPEDQGQGMRLHPQGGYGKGVSEERGEDFCSSYTGIFYQRLCLPLWCLLSGFRFLLAGINIQENKNW